MGTVLCSAYRRINHKMKLAQFVAISCLLAVSSSAPQRRRNQNNVNTKFFTGNNAIDSAAWGAALGAGTQYFANQVVKGLSIYYVIRYGGAGVFPIYYNIA